MRHAPEPGCDHPRPLNNAEGSKLVNTDEAYLQAAEMILELGDVFVTLTEQGLISETLETVMKRAEAIQLLLADQVHYSMKEAQAENPQDVLDVL